jgi:hypothetical protein
MSENATAHTLVTPRLRLVPAAPARMRRARRSGAAAVLDATIAPDWPPEHHDIDTLSSRPTACSASSDSTQPSPLKPASSRSACGAARDRGRARVVNLVLVIVLVVATALAVIR